MQVIITTMMTIIVIVVVIIIIIIHIFILPWVVLKRQWQQIMSLHITVR